MHRPNTPEDSTARGGPGLARRAASIADWMASLTTPLGSPAG